MPPQPREPLLGDVPGVVVATAGVLVAVHAARQIIPAGADARLVELLAFNPAHYGGQSHLPGGMWSAVGGFLTHALLHGDLMHLGLNCAWLLAVGALIARRMPALSFINFFVLCAVGGALLFMAVHPARDAAVIGASGAISGLMGAMFRLVFAAEDAPGWQLLRERPMTVPRLSLRTLVSRPGARTALLAWVAMNVVAAVAIGHTGGPSIAWEAHLGGFATGLGLFGLFDRGRAEGDPSHPAAG